MYIFSRVSYTSSFFFFFFSSRRRHTRLQGDWSSDVCSSDLESEGKDVGPDTLEYIHRHKTAALIRVSLTAGATLGGGRDAQVAPIRRAGEALGLAFQIVDDILDVEGSLAELGKTAGSDVRKKKVTYPALHGLDASKRKARELIEETKRLLEPLGPPAEPIRALADFVFERRS